MSSKQKPILSGDSVDPSELTTTMKVIQAKAFVEEATNGATSVRTEFKPPRLRWTQRLLRWLRNI